MIKKNQSKGNLERQENTHFSENDTPEEERLTALISDIEKYSGVLESLKNAVNKKVHKFAPDERIIYDSLMSRLSTENDNNDYLKELAEKAKEYSINSTRKTTNNLEYTAALGFLDLSKSYFKERINPFTGIKRVLEDGGNVVGTSVMLEYSLSRRLKGKRQGMQSLEKILSMGDNDSRPLAGLKKNLDAYAKGFDGFSKNLQVYLGKIDSATKKVIDAYSTSDDSKDSSVISEKLKKKLYTIKKDINGMNEQFENLVSGYNKNLHQFKEWWYKRFGSFFDQKPKNKLMEELENYLKKDGAFSETYSRIEDSKQAISTMTDKAGFLEDAINSMNPDINPGPSSGYRESFLQNPPPYEGNKNEDNSVSAKNEYSKSAKENEPLKSDNGYGKQPSGNKLSSSDIKGINELQADYFNRINDRIKSKNISLQDMVDNFNEIPGNSRTYENPQQQSTREIKDRYSSDYSTKNDIPFGVIDTFGMLFSLGASSMYDGAKSIASGMYSKIGDAYQGIKSSIFNPFRKRPRYQRGFGINMI